MARRDHLLCIEAELQQVRADQDRYQREFENLQDSGPLPARALQKMADKVKYSVRSNSHHAAKFSMLLPQQQRVANMTREIGKMMDDLIHLVSFITVTETTNESGRFNDVLANPTLKKSKPSPSWNKKSKTQMISLPNLTSIYLCQTSVRPRQVSDMTQLTWISETL
jgi:hypothetical protein